KATNGIFAPRYAIPAVIGFALTPALAPIARCQDSRRLGAFYCCVFTCWFIGQQWWALARGGAPMTVSERFERIMDRHDAIVVADAHSYLRIAYYLPERIRMHVYYIASPERAKRDLSYDDDDRSLLLLKRWAPLNVMDLASFRKAHNQFAVV